MKRISMLLMIMLIVVPRVTTAYYGSYSSIRYRTRWSPYVHGLVSGDVHYSPYAFKYGHSGLVSDDDVRYSPYAFSYKHPSGLVSDHGFYTPRRVLSHIHSGLVDYDAHRSSYAFRQNPYYRVCQIKESYEKKLRTHRATIGKLKQDARKTNITRQEDGEEVICRYLKSKGIDFKTNRLLKIDNKTVSVDFLLKDKNTIIKYWDPEEIRSLAQQPEYKRTFYENYKERSGSFCDEYKKAGGKVYQIESANTREILARLMLCHALNDG